MPALHDIVTKGSVDRSVVVHIMDSTDGTPETGVVFNTSGIDLWYRREGAAVTSITEATLAALTTAHTDGGFLHVANGDYRLDLPDAAFATGANYVDFGGTVTGMIVVGGRVRLVDFNLETANVTVASGGITDASFATTAGPISALGILDQGTAQSATGTTLVLRAAAAFADDEIIGATIYIVSATAGAGQSRVITDYVLSTDTATVDTWTTTPTGTIVYKIFATAPGAGTAAADIRAAVGLASANLDTQLTTIDNFLDTEVAAILALLDDPRTEPGQGAPPVNPDLATKIDYLYKAWRNRTTQTSTQYTLYADDTTTVDQKATCSSDGTTLVRGEIATGP